MQYASVGTRRDKEDIVLDDTRVVRSSTDVLHQFELAGNYPNPFTSQTTITFITPEKASVRLAVYDLLGRRVSVLVDERLPAGKHEIPFAAENLPKGKYLYRQTTPKGEFSRLMMLQ